MVEAGAPRQRAPGFIQLPTPATSRCSSARRRRSYSCPLDGSGWRHRRRRRGGGLCRVTLEASCPTRLGRTRVLGPLNVSVRVPPFDSACSLWRRAQQLLSHSPSNTAATSAPGRQDPVDELAPACSRLRFARGQLRARARRAAAVDLGAAPLAGARSESPRWRCHAVGPNMSPTVAEPGALESRRVAGEGPEDGDASPRFNGERPMASRARQPGPRP